MEDEEKETEKRRNTHYYDPKGLHLFHLFIYFAAGHC